MGLTDKHLAYGDDIPQTQTEKDYYWKIKHLEEQNNKLKEAIENMDKWVHSGNRGNCDYFIVDQVEEIINGLKKDGMVSE